MGRRLILALVCAIVPAVHAAAEPLRALRTSPGVHVFIGAAEEASADNGGRIGNLGVITGTRGSLVVGTGSSNTHGEALLAAVARLSGKPVLLAVNMQATPDHVLGNTAFSRHGIAILAHRNVAAYMAAHCEQCLKAVTESVGAAPLQGSQPIQPTQLVDGDTSIDLGDRVVDLIWFGDGPRPGVLAVFDRRSRVLFAGALATFDVVPDARDADLDGWLTQLHTLSRLRPRLIVPGIGRPGTVARLNEVAAYLTGLKQATRSAYDNDLSLASAPSSAHLPRFESWALYGTRHPRNVHFEYLRREARELNASPIGVTPAPDRTD
jgi:glyoxylase-like metal-dependent hydrolase (beta-lactamase superfamily II)